MKDTPEQSLPNIEEQFNLMAEGARIKKMREAEEADFFFILGQLANPHPYLAKIAATTLAVLWPPATLSERWKGQIQGGASNQEGLPDWLIRGCRDWDSESNIIQKVLTIFDQFDLSGQERFLTQLTGLTSLAEMVIRSLSIDRPHLATSLQSNVTQVLKARFPSQINFAPTMACQLNCPYCVSGDLGPERTAEIDPETLSSFLDWVQQSAIGRIALAGGEPTLYRHFPWMLDEFARRGLEFVLATNGLFDWERRKQIIAARPLAVSLHLTPQVRFSGQLKSFVQSAREMTAKGLLVALRINLTAPDEDVSFFVSLAREAGISEVRAAVTIPNANLSNRFVGLDQLQLFSSRIAQLFSEGRRQGIKVFLCKPFPLCALPLSTAQDLLESESLAVNCPVHMNEFSNNLVVWPDLSFSPCLGLSFQTKGPIIECKNTVEAAQGYRHRVMNLLQTPLMESCRNCPLGSGGRCIGACLSYRLIPQNPPDL
jgi:hypothetical protein